MESADWPIVVSGKYPRRYLPSLVGWLGACNPNCSQRRAGWCTHADSYIGGLFDGREPNCRCQIDFCERNRWRRLRADDTRQQQSTLGGQSRTDEKVPPRNGTVLYRAKALFSVKAPKDLWLPKYNNSTCQKTKKHSCECGQHH